MQVCGKIRQRIKNGKMHTIKIKPYEIESYLRGKGIQFRRRGQKAECKICPFCSGGESNDKYTFVVYLDESGGNYKCQRGKCAVSGSFWQLAEHFDDDPKEFYERGNAFKPQPRTESAIAPELVPDLSFHAETVEPQKLTPAALEYLEKRKFNPEVLEQLPIWCDEQGLINFGYYHESELCFVKVRKPRKPADTEQKAWAKWKKGLRTLWLLELCDLSKDYIVITFGEYDAVACRQAQIENVVSVPSGDTDLEWMNICFDKLKNLSEIYLWIDNDDAGRKALPKIAARLGEKKIKVVRTKYKDANEMLVKVALETDIENAQNEIWNAVVQAEWYLKGDVIDFADIEDEEISFEGYKTGLQFLDFNLGGMLQGRLTVHTGNTKAGKSSAVTQIICNAITDGAKVCVWSGEMSKSEFKYNVGVHVAGYEGFEVGTTRTGAEYARIKPEFAEKVRQWAKGNLFVLSHKGKMTVEIMLENFRLAYERFGCEVFVGDNLMKLVAGKGSDNVNFAQTTIVNSFSDFVKETKTHGHLVTHTSKADSDQAPPKTINEVSGAKEIVNLCDSLVSWWRVPEEKQAEFDNASTVCTILANRVFPVRNASMNLIYDWRVKRFAENQAQLTGAKYDLKN